MLITGTRWMRLAGKTRSGSGRTAGALALDRPALALAGEEAMDQTKLLNSTLTTVGASGPDLSAFTSKEGRILSKQSGGRS
jgi:hypothetical protein